MKEVGGFPLATEIGYQMSNVTNSMTAKVLIVDENPLSRMTAFDLLTLDGYEVLEADSLAAVSASVLKQPDLILLDAMMRQVNSFALCRQLKADGFAGNIPIIFTTLVDSRENRIKAMEAGGSDLLLKPLNRIELSTKVKSLIDQNRAHEAPDQTEQVLLTVAKAADSRSANKGGSHRVVALVDSFGNYLGLTAAEIKDLSLAAQLHNIGTIAIPDAVMLKTGQLTTEEKETIGQHVLLGEEICQPLRLSNRSGVLPIIRHHHEKWDGSGYPDGLSGVEIPYLAQVFQIIDIYDALTSDRPHKRAYSQAQALQTIVEETQRGWRNPELIEKFTNFIREREQYN